MIDMANSEALSCEGKTKELELKTQDYKVKTSFCILSFGNYNTILRKPWLYDANQQSIGARTKWSLKPGTIAGFSKGNKREQSQKYNSVMIASSLANR